MRSFFADILRLSAQEDELYIKSCQSNSSTMFLGQTGKIGSLPHCLSQLERVLNALGVETGASGQGYWSNNDKCREIGPITSNSEFGLEAKTEGL